MCPVFQEKIIERKDIWIKSLKNLIPVLSAYVKTLYKFLKLGQISEPH